MGYERKDLLDNQKTDCGPGNESFDLTKGNDILTQDRYVEESLNIGGAVVNVFKLLGIHEQGTLIDLTGQGRPISSGNAHTDWAASNVYNSSEACGGWRSIEKGQDVIRTAYLGYDFGPIYDHEDERNIYGIETNISHHITTLKIKQGSDSTKRVTKARIERSLDGKTWYGADLVDLPDDDNLNEINFKGSSASRYWRIRPTAFNGVTANDMWEVTQLELMDWEETSLYNVQDQMGFLESRDRDYAKESIEIKGSYDLLDIQTDVGMFGQAPASQNLYLMLSFSQCVRRLGRPIVVGDILEIPSEAQYAHDLQRVKKYMEVTDVAWSTEGYTPGWQPTLFRVIIEPMISSQETLDIIGDIKQPDATGFLDIDDEEYTDLTDQDHRVDTQADTNVPERGEDQYEIAHIDEDEVESIAASTGGINVGKLSSNQGKLYVEDGLPPNGLPYTEGPKYPTDPNDRDYHRITNDKFNIPARLFRYSVAKTRWIYCETDRRDQYNTMKPTLQNMITSASAVPTSDITGRAEDDVTTEQELNDEC